MFNLIKPQLVGCKECGEEWETLETSPICTPCFKLSNEKIKSQEENNMGKLIDEAKDYTPPQTKNIADLDEVPVEVDLEERSGNDKDGKDFHYKVLVLNDEDYRVPNSVLKALKTIVEEKPDLKTIKVKKTGEGLNTEYTVIPLV